MITLIPLDPTDEKLVEHVAQISAYIQKWGPQAVEARTDSNKRRARERRYTSLGYLSYRYAYMVRSKPGVSLPPRDKFIRWAWLDRGFIELYTAYTASGRPKNLAPVVDPINSTLGYEIGNLQWMASGAKRRKEALLLDGKHQRMASQGARTTPI
jgi:hypothetical protein